ncbi:hypothetical protein HU200_035352 [Digitaria exilis]|uniref:Reverse transcriptase zinc-binding domain-containing protein n=1 Tax=Digitaria exilis TaxID=1010633 RepID=A0A835EPD0_9POAL|nr:hypothetical protein HU200_035352 [Digitaria exilis]
MHLDYYNYVFCVENTQETIMHLFFECRFRIFLGIQWSLNLQKLDMVISAQQTFGSAIFREIIIVAAWFIWTHRNITTFARVSLSFAKWRHMFFIEMNVVTLRACLDGGEVGKNTVATVLGNVFCEIEE